MEKSYTISRQVYEDLDYMKNMISVMRDDVFEIMNEEPNLSKFQIGYKVGRLHLFIQDKHVDFIELLDKIKESEITP